MTALKIGAIVGSLVIAAVGSAAVATRDKWWPGEETKPLETSDQDDGGSSGVPDSAKGVGSATTEQSGIATQSHH